MYRLGVAVSLILGIVFTYLSYTLTIMNNQKPGPGLWPFILSLVIIVASILSLLFEKGAQHYEGFSRNSRFSFYAIISLVIFVLLFDWVGFLLPGFLLLIFWFKFLGNESWRLSIITSLAVTGGLYVLFVYLLEVPFPTGSLFS